MKASRPRRRRVIQISMSSTDHMVNNGNTNYLISALCNDGTIFIASATTGWLKMADVPQPTPKKNASTDGAIEELRKAML